MSIPTKRITELGEEEVPLDASDLAVVVTDVSTTPTTKKTKLGTLRRFMLGIASVGTLVFPEQNQTLGTAVTGTNAASADVTVSVAPGTGAGGPAAYVVRVPVRVGGATDVQTLTEAFRVQEIANSSSWEVAAWNVTGPVMGLIPANAASYFLTNGDGARFATRTRLLRVGNTPAYVGERVNGSFASPTQALSGQAMVAVAGNARTDTGTQVTIGSFNNFLRENATASAFGSAWLWQAVDIGGSALKDVFRVQGGGSGIAEWLSGQSTLRIIPGATQFAIRDSGNTADIHSINGTGTTVLWPVATAFVVGGDPGGGHLGRFGGTVIIQNSNDVASLNLVNTSTGAGEVILGTRIVNSASLSAGWTGRKARVGPSALLSGDVIVAMFGAGYGATGYGNNVGAIRIIAAENFTDTARGTDVDIATTAQGASSRTVRVTVKSEGQMRLVPLTADPSRAENGDIYYNSTTSKFRGYAGGAWTDLH